MHKHAALKRSCARQTQTQPRPATSSVIKVQCFRVGSESRSHKPLHLHTPPPPHSSPALVVSQCKQLWHGCSACESCVLLCDSCGCRSCHDEQVQDTALTDPLHRLVTTPHSLNINIHLSCIQPARHVPTNAVCQRLPSHNSSAAFSQQLSSVQSTHRALRGTRTQSVDTGNKHSGFQKPLQTRWHNTLLTELSLQTGQMVHVMP